MSGFTLAEILIAMTIIGIIAVTVLPGFVKNYKQKAYNRHRELFSSKLLEATKQMNFRSELVPYSTTKKFSEKFKNYIKIVQICDSYELEKCFSEKIKYNDEFLEVKDLADSESFGKETYSTANIGITFTDGVLAIISYNPECPSIDPYNLKDFDTSSCLSYLLDINGYAKPNKIGEDIFTVGVEIQLPNKAQTLNIPCIEFEGYGNCKSNPLRVSKEPDHTAKEYIGTSNGLAGENNMSASGNGARMSWALANKTCQDKGMRLPNASELHYMWEAAQQGIIPGFQPDNYWTSDNLTALGTPEGHNCNMKAGNCGRKNLEAQNYVRCIPK